MNVKCPHAQEPVLYKIGMFAQMNKVTIKALRHYDELGLLKPHFVDEHSGYRYYTSQQLPILHQILALRAIGFSLEEVGQVIHQGISEQALLQKKKAEVLQEMSEMTKKLSAIESYLVEKPEQGTSYVVIKSLPKLIIASVRVHLQDYAALFDEMPRMGMLMEEAECSCMEPDTCFTIYYEDGYKESDIDAELCQAVTELKENYKELSFRELPEMEQAACILHKGPYETLPQSYQMVVSFMEENGYEIVGQQREMYIDGVWNKDSEQDWLTEIQFPIRK